MPTLAEYNQFSGRHYETGTIANYYAATGVVAPHTHEPISEALLMGISGGAVMGYFFFHYEGYDPMIRILTRNTFDPWDTMLSRLGVIQNTKQTTKATKAVKNLTDVLEDGVPAIVWADHFTMPYNVNIWGGEMWGMMPLIVYGYDEEGDAVSIADGSDRPLIVTTETLATARARVKKDKHRIMTLDRPLWEKLPAAVTAGIWDCIALYTEKPPKGSVNNFGFKAYDHWIDLLTGTKHRNRWNKVMVSEAELIPGVIEAYEDIRQTAEREIYADFLNEAALILENPALNGVADQFRQSASLWEDVASALLPDSIEPLGKLAELSDRKLELFVEQGADSVVERHAVQDEMKTLREGISLSGDARAAYQANIAEKVAAVRDVERAAINELRALMGTR